MKEMDGISKNDYEKTRTTNSVVRATLATLANKEIAARLNVSESSVKAALQQLFQKTGVRTRSQLVRIALEEYSDRRR